MTEQGHWNKTFAILGSANNRTFENERKWLLCGPVQRKALGFPTQNAVRDLLKAVAHACVIKCRGAP